MKAKRIGFATGLLLLGVSAAHRVDAGTEAPNGDKVSGELDVGGHVGQTSGGWTCGPQGTLHYGGLGASGSISQRSSKSKDGRGATGRIAASVEWQSVSIDPSTDLNNAQPTPEGPPDFVALGAQFRAGYHWHFISIEGGGGFYQGYDSPSASKPELVLYPAVELTVGRLRSIYGVAGGGAHFFGTLSRPGFYFGGGMISEGGWQGDIRLGLFRQGPSQLDTIGPRLDLMGKVPVSDWLALRLGGSLGLPEDDRHVDLEGSLGVVFGL